MPDEPSQPRFKRLFTLTEANELVPQLTEWMRELRKRHEQIRRVVESKQELAKGNGKMVVETQQLERDLNSVTGNAQTIQGIIQLMADLGVELKDVEQGLADFPHRRKGRIVYLCWKLGEDSITHWHELETGFAGRKPI